MLELSSIRIDGGTQSRAEQNQSVVTEYADAYKNGAQMPPVVVFYDGSEYWLADGFHRYLAAKQADKKAISEEVIPGTRRDAVLYSLGANARHGLRRSNADKRRAVETMLSDAEWSEWSDVAIAKAAGVSSNFVGDVRRIINPINDNHTKTVKRNGKTYQQNTASIGKTKPDPKPEDDYRPEDDEVAELSETVRLLAAENDALKDSLLVGAMPSGLEEQASALETIKALRKEIDRLEVENRALVASRDSYQRENAELKRQCAMQRKQLAIFDKRAA